MRAFVATAVGVTLALAAPISAQRPGRVLEPVAHTVRLDVLASDAAGRPLDTLKTSDFELQEDGQTLPIDDVRFVSVEPARGTDQPQPVESRPDERREANRADTRLLAVFVDEYHISPDSLARTKALLTALVDRELGPRDLLVVMKPLESLLSIRLTHDREAARSMVAALDGRKGDYTARNAYERNSWAGTPQRIEAARTQVAISALNALAVHMGSLGEGRKTLVVVTEGFVGVPRNRGQEGLATIDGVIRSANRSKVAIYPIDPRSGPGTVSVAADSPDTFEQQAQAVLKRLADETTGRMTASGAGDLNVAVRQAVRDASAYFLVTYRSSHREDGRFHPVVIRSPRASVQLRARAGFWAPSADDRLLAELVARASAPPPPIKLEPPRHLSPFIQPWFGLSRGTNGKTRVTFVWEPAGRVPGERSLRSAARLVLTALGSDDSVLFQGDVLPTGAGTTDDPNGTPTRVSFEAPPGQRLRLRMQIQDVALQVLDSDVRDIAVRDFSRGVSIATPEIMRTRNAREFRLLDDDAAAVPVSSREFSRTEHLIIRFAAYAPDGQPPVTTARLLNRGGQEMRTLSLENGPEGLQQCDLLLAGLAPAEYRLELTAAAGGAQTKELIEFRVTN